MALEDAAALEVFFAPENFNPEHDSIEKRLQLWNQFRRPRVIATQLLSNASIMRGSREEAMKEIRGLYSGPLPAADAAMWGPQFQDFFYGYDVFKEADKAVKYKDAVGGIPDGVIEHFGLKAEINGDANGSFDWERYEAFKARKNNDDGPEVMGNW